MLRNFIFYNTIFISIGGEKEVNVFLFGTNVEKKLYKKHILNNVSNYPWKKIQNLKFKLKQSWKKKINLLYSEINQDHWHQRSQSYEPYCIIQRITKRSLSGRLDYLEKTSNKMTLYIDLAILKLHLSTIQIREVTVSIYNTDVFQLTMITFKTNNKILFCL